MSKNKSTNKHMKTTTLRMSEDEAALVADLIYVYMLDAQEQFEEAPTKKNHNFAVQAESLYQRAGDALQTFNR